VTVSDLKRIHLDKQKQIQARLAEFEEVGRSGSREKLFEELSFCIFTAGASARMGLRSVDRIRPFLMSGSIDEIQRALFGVHRWSIARGAYVYETREYLREHCGLRLLRLLSSFGGADERRDFFAANLRVRGLGYKEASHFLRNLGYRGYAILDRHILNCLREFRVITRTEPPSAKKGYVEVEERMKEFAERIDIDFDELDLLLWYTKTAEILK
jgi:N-glycosylase/DNA lyase